MIYRIRSVFPGFKHLLHKIYSRYRCESKKFFFRFYLDSRKFSVLYLCMSVCAAFVVWRTSKPILNFLPCTHQHQVSSFVLGLSVLLSSVTLPVSLSFVCWPLLLVISGRCHLYSFLNLGWTVNWQICFIIPHNILGFLLQRRH